MGGKPGFHWLPPPSVHIESKGPSGNPGAWVAQWDSRMAVMTQDQDVGRSQLLRLQVQLQVLEGIGS